MVIDRSRIVVGFLILLFFTFCFFLKYDFLILSIITLLVLYELYKSSFIKDIYDYVLIVFFIALFPLIFKDYQIINTLNILLICVALLNIFFPNFYLKRFFLIGILIFIHNFFSLLYYDRVILYLIFFTAFFNDTIAYIFGKLIKGPLIIPPISPNKTWSGTLISFIFTSILIYQFNISILIIIILSMSLFVGDIFYSHIKRKNNIKDFSNLLQGHGGILDRLDSMHFFIIIINFIYL